MGGSRLLARWNIFMQLDTHYTHYTHKRTHTQSTVHPSVRRRATEVASQHCEGVGGGLLAVPTCNSLCITVSDAHVHFCESAQAESRRTRRVQPIACYARCIVSRAPPAGTPRSLDRKYRARERTFLRRRAKIFSALPSPLLTDRSPAYCCEKEKIHVRLHT